MPLTIFDASALIAHFDSDDEHHSRAEELLLAAAKGQMGASTVTIAETLVRAANSGMLRAARAELEEVGVEELGFEAGNAEELARLRAETRLKMPDCCVLLVAERWGGSIVTFDDPLATVATGRGVDVVDAG